MSKGYAFHLGSGILVAVLVTVILTLALSACVLLLSVPVSYVTVANQLIKVLSVFCAVLFLRKREEGRCLSFGIMVGGGYIALGIFIYCAVSGRLLPLFSIAAELALGVISGLLSGIAVSHLPEKALNKRKRRRN